MLEVDEGSQRSLTAKGRATRQRIIEVASDLMVVRGVAAVTLDEVGLATSTSKSQMYHYFASKDDLVSCVVTYVRDQILASHARMLVEVTSIDDVQRWAHAIIEFQRYSPQLSGCPLGTLASELVNESGSEHLGIRESFYSWESLLEDALRRLRDAGELRADANPYRLAMATLASLQGGLLMSKVLQSVTPLTVALDAAVSYLRTFSGD